MKDKATRDRQRKEPKRERTEPARRDKPSDRPSGDKPSKGWQGQPSENAERRRGEGRGLDEPHKRMPPDELD